MAYNDAQKYLKLIVVGLISTAAFLPAAALAEDKVKPNQKPKPEGYLKLFHTQKKKRDLIQATNNAKQLFLLMIEFDQDFGAFPNDDTAAADNDLKKYKGAYSNDYLGQFLAGGYIASEKIFFAKGGSRADRQPDNDFSTQEKTLQGGECGFAYIKDQSTSNHSGRPLLCAPMTGKGYKFDPKPYNGKAVVLRIDGSVRHYPINEDGDVVLPNGKKLFEGGAGTVWGENGPQKGMLVFPKPDLSV